MPKAKQRAADTGPLDTEAMPPPLLALERYEVILVHRSQVKNASYNPRVMSEAALRKLRAGIKKLGFLGPPIWNRASGNIVGGHQRMKVMDQLQGTRDYSLKVAAVDLSEAEEKEANILLNNSSAQGDWDIEKLEKMLHAGDLDLSATGFDMADVYRLLGDSPLLERGQAEVDQLAAKVREARERYESIMQGNLDRDSPDFYLVVVFRDRDDRKAFLDKLGLDENRYVDGRELGRLLSRQTDREP
jgi:hypothetical protein